MGIHRGVGADILERRIAAFLLYRWRRRYGQPRYRSGNGRRRSLIQCYFGRLGQDLWGRRDPLWGGVLGQFESAGRSGTDSPCWPAVKA